MHSYETLSMKPAISCVCRNFKVWLFFYIVIDPATSEFSLSSKLNIVNIWMNLHHANEEQNTNKFQG